MKVAWFSPLPPAHSDIANFTARLAGLLMERYSARFFTDAATGFQEPAAGTTYPAALGAVAAGLVPVLNTFDVPVYNLGNHPGFFAHTWFLSQRKPGLVVLHDLKLHHFFEGIYRERLGDQSTYLKLLRRYHGSLGYEAGLAYWQQEVSVDFMAEHFPMTAWAVEGALGIVVHTPHALRVVQAQTEIPVILVPLPYPRRAVPATGELPSTELSENRRARLVIFGYLNVNRRIIEFLTALAAMPERARFEVQIFGEMQHRSEIESTLDALALRQQVTLHGYVSEETLESGLAWADLAVNLRYPSMGEASGSQLRLWDHALPSLVTLTEGYAALPADAVFFVRPEHETADIQQHLRRLLAEPETFRRAGQNGRRYLETEHRPETYVQRLDELLGRVDELRSRHTQLRLAERIGLGMAPWSDAAPQTAREWFYADTVARVV